MKRVILVFALVAAAIPFAMADGQPGSDQLRVGASTLTASHTFYQPIKAALEDGVTAQDVDLSVTAADQDLNRQLSSVEGFVNKSRNLDSFVVQASAEKESDDAAAVPASAHSGGGTPELVIGEERVEPGVIFIFEGAVKDTIMPSSMHLSESQTHVHIEARANWDTKNIPEGTPAEGFVPYLHITAEVINQNDSKLRAFIDLLPHLNLIDNTHYARNITLPGKISDLYTVVFNITPPALTELALHKDWTDMYGDQLLEQTTLRYKDVDFEDIAKATRR